MDGNTIPCMQSLDIANDSLGISYGLGVSTLLLVIGSIVFISYLIFALQPIYNISGDYSLWKYCRLALNSCRELWIMSLLYWQQMSKYMGWYSYTVYSCSLLMTYKYIIQIAIKHKPVCNNLLCIITHMHEDSLTHWLAKLTILNKQYSYMLLACKN